MSKKQNKGEWWVIYLLNRCRQTPFFLLFTSGTRSGKGCGTPGETLWDTCRSTAALLRSGTRRTSPRWGLPPARLSSQTPAGLQTGGSALSRCWTPTLGPASPPRTPSAAAGAWPEPPCCCLADWSPRWTAPSGRHRIYVTLLSPPPTFQALVAHTSVSYKTDFVLVLWLVLDDYNGPGGRSPSSLCWGGRRRVHGRLPGNRAAVKWREMCEYDIVKNKHSHLAWLMAGVAI